MRKALLNRNLLGECSMGLRRTGILRARRGTGMPHTCDAKMVMYKVFSYGCSIANHAIPMVNHRAYALSRALVSEELESNIAAGAGLRRTGIQHCMVSEALASMQYTTCPQRLQILRPSAQLSRAVLFISVHVHVHVTSHTPAGFFRRLLLGAWRCICICISIDAIACRPLRSLQHLT